MQGGGDQDEDEQHDDEPQETGNLYDSTAQKVELSDDEEDAPVQARAPSPDPEPEVQPQRAPSPDPVPVPAPAPVKVAPSAPVDSVYQSSKNDEALDRPIFAVALNAGKTRGAAVDLSEADVGKRVTVLKYGVGTLRFFGPHHRDGKPRCGVELDEANGINNGTVGVRLFPFLSRPLFFFLF